MWATCFTIVASISTCMRNAFFCHWFFLICFFCFNLCTGPQIFRGNKGAVCVDIRQAGFDSSLGGKHRLGFRIGSSFQRPRAWHKRSVQAKPFVCDKCNQSFSYNRNLLRHKKACEGKFDLWCQYCEQVFYRPDVLKMHMQSKHGVDAVPR